MGLRSLPKDLKLTILEGLGGVIGHRLEPPWGAHGSSVQWYAPQENQRQQFYCFRVQR